MNFFFCFQIIFGAQSKYFHSKLLIFINVKMLFTFTKIDLSEDT